MPRDDEAPRNEGSKGPGTLASLLTAATVIVVVVGVVAKIATGVRAVKQPERVVQPDPGLSTEAHDKLMRTAEEAGRKDAGKVSLFGPAGVVEPVTIDGLTVRVVGVELGRVKYRTESGETDSRGDEDSLL